MKVAVFGYGRMGHEVERILGERGHEVAARVDPSHGEADSADPAVGLLRRADVAIEFSAPEAVRANAAAYAEAGIPAVVGTTGWDTDHAAVRDIVEKSGIGYLAGNNFSVGAHLFFAIVAEAARLIGPFPEYDIMVHEIFHRHKKDSPSGTALTVADRIRTNLSRKTAVVTGMLEREIRPEELHVTSTRGGSVPGIHSVIIDSPADTIEISHTARNRSGLAAGAVLAAEWLRGKSGFFTVEDFFRSVLT